MHDDDDLITTPVPTCRGERGAGVVEWLGISALSIALLATIFTGLNAVGLDLLDFIRSTLGL
jgi:hypothetical protein